MCVEAAWSAFEQFCEWSSRSYLRPLMAFSATTHATSLCKKRHVDATVQDRHVNEWESLVKYTEWQIAPRTPLTAHFRAKWGIICIQIVCLYESMMDEHTDIDSTTVLLEGQGLMGVAWRKIAKKGPIDTRATYYLWEVIPTQLKNESMLVRSQRAAITFLYWTNQRNVLPFDKLLL